MGKHNTHHKQDFDFKLGLTLTTIMKFFTEIVLAIYFIINCLSYLFYYKLYEGIKNNYTIVILYFISSQVSFNSYIRCLMLLISKLFIFISDIFNISFNVSFSFC